MDGCEKCKNYEPDEPIVKSYLPWLAGTQHRNLAAVGAIAALKELRSRYYNWRPLGGDARVNLNEVVEKVSEMIQECQNETGCVVV